ncbi:MAG: nitrate- and nitrite sensing domain-containing protein, partial [Mixta sp.]
MQNTLSYAGRYLAAARESERSALQDLLQRECLLSAIGGLIHALQRERGASTIWLCSADGQTPLAVRQAEVDLALSALLAALPSPESGAASRFYGRLALALHTLDGLTALREQVRRRQLAHSEAIQQF